MTTVNSPACLLARNHFYRSLPPSAEPMKPTFSCQNKQRPATLWVTVETAPVSCINQCEGLSAEPPVDVRWNCGRCREEETGEGLPGLMGAKGFWVSIVLGSSSSAPYSASKPANPAAQRAK